MANEVVIGGTQFHCEVGASGGFYLSSKPLGAHYVAWAHEKEAEAARGR